MLRIIKSLAVLLVLPVVFVAFPATSSYAAETGEACEIVESIFGNNDDCVQGDDVCVVTDAADKYHGVCRDPGDADAQAEAAAAGEDCGATKLCQTGLSCVDNVCQDVAAADAAPITQPNNASTDGASNLGTARSEKYGLKALSSTNLYQGEPQTLVINIVRQVFIFVGAILVLLIIYGGITYMTGASGGSKEKVNSGKKILTAAIVGTVIVFSAYLIAEFVIRALTAS